MALEKEDYITLATLFNNCANTHHAGQFAKAMAKELLAKAGIIEPPKWYEVKLPDAVRAKIQQALYFQEDGGVRCKFCQIVNGHSRVCATMGLADTVPGPDEFISKIEQMLREKSNGAAS